MKARISDYRFIRSKMKSIEQNLIQPRYKVIVNNNAAFRFEEKIRTDKYYSSLKLENIPQ